MNECRSRRSSGQIPAFGNWEYANELPITQYFESARQAGLHRYSSSSGECDPYMVTTDLNKNQPSPPVLLPLKTATRKVREKRSTHVKEQGKQQNNKVGSDVTAPSTTTRKTIRNQLLLLQHHNYVDAGGPTPKLPGVAAARAPKPVDEDLYKISPDLLHISKRKKMLGIFPRCLLPPCVV